MTFTPVIQTLELNQLLYDLTFTAANVHFLQFTLYQTCFQLVIDLPNLQQQNM